jgi:hypothetical protein
MASDAAIVKGAKSLGQPDLDRGPVHRRWSNPGAVSSAPPQEEIGRTVMPSPLEALF